jgi:uncharacterized LabA/DUF88 family protein
MPRYNNYAYIDGVNLHLTYESADFDWKVDYNKLLNYLQKKYGVIVAHYFLGNTASTKPIYEKLSSYGYNIKLKEPSPYRDKEKVCPYCNKVIEPETQKYKADVDSYMTMQIMADMNDFDKAIIVTSDGDFDEIVKMLLNRDKLRLVFAPCREGCSKLLQRVAVDKIAYIDDFKYALEKR